MMWRIWSPRKARSRKDGRLVSMVGSPWRAAQTLAEEEASVPFRLLARPVLQHAEEPVAELAVERLGAEARGIEPRPMAAARQRHLLRHGHEPGPEALAAGRLADPQHLDQQPAIGGGPDK